MSNFYVTTYCNKAHRLADGKPIEHECHVLPPEVLHLEREGKIEEALAVLQQAKPLRVSRGVIDDETGAPNLDAMPATELRAFAARIAADPRAMALALFPARPRGYLRATRRLRTYADYKALAMSLRERGQITGALHEEAYCERIYNNLPAFARW